MPRHKDEQKFKRHEKVVAAVDLPGVPSGTKGKIQIVNGLSWIRYWVVFANGVELGQLGNDDLSTTADWDAQVTRRRQAERAAEAEERRARYRGPAGSHLTRRRPGAEQANEAGERRGRA